MTSVEDSFERARKHAAGGHLAVVRLDGQCLILPVVAPSSVKAEMVVAMERIILSTTKRNVAVMSDTSWATVAPPTLQAANRAIPFFGLLMGFASIGHSVWVFHGAPDLLSAGCRDADVLIVDSAFVAALPSNWQAVAAKAMRNPLILIHDRASYRLLKPAAG